MLRPVTLESAPCSVLSRAKFIWGFFSASISWVASNLVHVSGVLSFIACAIWMSGKSSLRAISVSSCKHLIYTREEYTSFSFTCRICSWSWSFTNRKEKVFVFLLVLFTDYKFCSPVWNKNYRSFVYLIAVTLKSSIRFHVPYVILGNTQTKW